MKKRTFGFLLILGLVLPSMVVGGVIAGSGQGKGSGTSSTNLLQEIDAKQEAESERISNRSHEGVYINSNIGKFSATVPVGGANPIVPTPPITTPLPQNKGIEFYGKSQYLQYSSSRSNWYVTPRGANKLWSSGKNIGGGREIIYDVARQQFSENYIGYDIYRDGYKCIEPFNSRYGSTDCRIAHEAINSLSVINGKYVLSEVTKKITCTKRYPWLSATCDKGVEVGRASAYLTVNANKKQISSTKNATGVNLFNRASFQDIKIVGNNICFYTLDYKRGLTRKGCIGYRWK